MKKFILIASAAVVALASPVVAKPGGGNGHGNEGGGGGHGEHGGGNGHQGGQGERSFEGGDKHGDGGGHAFKFAEKAQRQQFRNEERGNGGMKHADRAFRDEQRHSNPARFVNYQNRDRYQDRNREERGDGWNEGRRDYRNGDYRQAQSFCPPGLAKKHNGCMPPGQAKKSYARGERYDYNGYNGYSGYNVPSGYRDVYYDTPDNYYRYDDNGYIYRVDRGSNMVSGLIPLLGGGFGVGQMLPSGYDAYNVPMQYRSTYYDTPDANYRYGDNAIYQVNPQNSMIESVAALLTGNNLGVGQMMPSGYDAYNLPMQYRDQYADNSNYDYRYADGNIYQVDTKTQIIQAIISALT